MSIIMLALAAATLAPPQFGEIKLSTGVRLHYAEQGPATGDVIITLHGYSDSWFSFSGVLPLLADRYKVYALSLRGHGESDRPASGYKRTDLANDVVAFMEAKRITRATIIGHSMGSLVAQQVAVRTPERVRRLILVGSARSLNEFGFIEELKAGVAALAEPVPEAFAREFQVSTIHHPIAAEFLERTIVESLKLPVRVWRELLTGMLTTEPATALGRLRIPTLVLRGEHDVYAVATAQAPLLEMIGSARLKTYRDTGHAVHWERPEWFVRDVKEFIEGKF
jgi:pimeloyl-ACP methyl ester carboxylesterase